MPLSLTLRNHDKPTSVSGRERRALESVAPWLKPTHQADSAAEFIHLGVSAALPRLPRFKQFSASLAYGYDPCAIVHHCDPSDCHDQSDKVARMFPHPIVFLDTGSHYWVELGHILPHLHKRDDQLAEWFAALLNALPFALAPHEWEGFIQMNCWRGELDEREVVAEHEADGEKYEGPTRAGYHAHVPQWVREKRPRLLADWVVNLRLLSRIRREGLDVSAFFDELTGEFIALRGFDAARIFNPLRPVNFGWVDADMVQAAIDEDYHLQQQVGETCQAFAAVSARNLAHTATLIGQAGSHLAALDRLCTDLNLYRRKHKLA